MATSTVENYLKTILLQTEGPGAMVPMGCLAAALAVTPGTVTTMVKGLAEKGLLEHHARSGVRLTPAGRAVALGVLRKHRLVETFLVQVLKMDWSEVHEEAEALEHAISDRVLARIDALLDHPSSDPHGDPIPNPKGQLHESRNRTTLATCELGKALRVVRISDQTPAFLEFIQQTGLKPGTRLKLLSRDPVAGVVQVGLGGRSRQALGTAEAAKIEVSLAG